MATKKATPTDEKFERQDLNIFDVLAALDRKDYNYYDTLSEEQQKKFAPYVVTHWMSAIKGNADLQRYFVQSVDYHVNKHLLNENVSKHPKLVWMMLCASSPGLGKQFHQWIPHLSTKISTLRETPKQKEVKEYYAKIYKNASDSDLTAISAAFIEDHKKKVYLAKLYPNLKISDIDVLSQQVTDDDIKQYERDRGN